MVSLSNYFLYILQNMFASIEIIKILNRVWRYTLVIIIFVYNFTKFKMTKLGNNSYNK